MYRSLSDDWINGMLAKGNNFICRMIPPSSTNHLSITSLVNPDLCDEIIDPQTECHWFVCKVMQVSLNREVNHQDKKVKKIPRMMIIETSTLTVTDFINQLHSLCNEYLEFSQ